MNTNWGSKLPAASVIVVVEDDRILRGLIVDVLTDMGAQCLEFETADDALIHLLNTPALCSLVITDHSLPGQLSGAELLGMITGKWPELPLILTTGLEDSSVQLPPRAVFLKKPWTLDQLIFAVASLVLPEPV